jgi:cell division cycle 20-like protein 1 (cofactor of APC complex)
VFCSRLNVVNEATSPYSLSPISAKSQKLLRSPRKATRKISKLPFKVLDAPELADDFYLNLVPALPKLQILVTDIWNYKYL